MTYSLRHIHWGLTLSVHKSDVLRMDEESVRFRTLNLGWAKGEELCCLVPLAMDNLNRQGERVIAAVESEWGV